jgi:hypothetical protein
MKPPSVTASCPIGACSEWYSQRARTGAGGFSRYVSDAVEREIRHDMLGELIEELEAEYGPVPPEVREQTRREWPDYEEE